MSVTFMPDWYTNTNYTGLYVAAARGYFRDAGVDVQFLPFPYDHRVDRAVAAGRADFGICYQEQITMVRAGEQLPLVAVAAIMQHNTTGFLALASSGIARPRDLAGKRFAAADTPTFRAVLGTIMAADGADIGTVRAMNLGVTDLLPALERGDADFAWVYAGWEGVDAPRRGLDATLIRISDWPAVPDYYTPCIVASEETVANRPETVRAFVHAAARGYGDAASDPGAAANLLIAAAPDAPADLIRASQPIVGPWYQADAPRWGMQAPERWHAYTDFLATHNLLPGHFDPTAAFTNAFVPGGAMSNEWE